MAASKKAKAKTEKKRPELTDPASVEEPLFTPLDTKLEKKYQKNSKAASRLRAK